MRQDTQTLFWDAKARKNVCEFELLKLDEK